ncbi:MAG: BON domain-containing protein [Bacteroidota bacterium]
MKTDSELQHDVMEEIKFDPLLASISSSIGVAVKDGVVTLSGEVETFIQKHAIEDAAKRVKGVSFIAVDIEVTLGTGKKWSDSDVAAHVKEALGHLSMIDTESIDVRVEAGWVTIDGTVRWNYQRKAAEAYIHNLEGVRGVSNHIELSDEPCDPKTIVEKINAAFHRHATLDASHVHVEIKDRRAVLSGEVRSWIEKKDAENAAWASPGIIAVDNLIRVNSSAYVH